MTKIAKDGSRGKEKTKFSSIASAYPNPVSYKDNIRQSQRKRLKQHFSSLSLAEPTTVIFNDSWQLLQRQATGKRDKSDYPKATPDIPYRSLLDLNPGDKPIR